jgi:hypothetical protein
MTMHKPAPIRQGIAMDGPRPRRAHRSADHSTSISGVKLNRNRSINVDVKKVQLRSAVSMAGEQISRVKLDPLRFGAGVGYRSCRSALPRSVELRSSGASRRLAMK